MLSGKSSLKVFPDVQTIIIVPKNSEEPEGICKTYRGAEKYSKY